MMTSQALSLFLAANHLSVSSIPNFKAREMQAKRKGGGVVASTSIVLQLHTYSTRA